MGYGLVKVSTTAKKIIGENTKRKVLWVVNASSGSTVYIGPDDSITTANAGVLLFPYQTIEIKKDFGDYKGDVYGIIGTTDDTCKVFYWEVEANL